VNQQLAIYRLLHFIRNDGKHQPYRHCEGGTTEVIFQLFNWNRHYEGGTTEVISWIGVQYIFKVNNEQIASPDSYRDSQ